MTSPSTEAVMAKLMEDMSEIDRQYINDALDAAVAIIKAREAK